MRIGTVEQTKPRERGVALTDSPAPPAGLGVDAACDPYPGLRRGLDTTAGAIIHEAETAAFG